MRRIGVLTFLHNDNYGSALQAYALQRVIREIGYDCVHLDYQPDRKEKILNLLRSGNNVKLILEGMRKRSVRTGQAGARRKSEAFPVFYSRKMELTQRCRNAGELRQACTSFDTLVCGSDQIWNPVWLNPAYFLTFARHNVRKIAYAPSLGIQTLPAASKIRKIRTWTRGFSAISVRETEGADILEQMTGIHAEVMPDPVCLLKKEAWEAIAAPAPEGEPYLLCYFIGTNETYRDKVRRISDETGLRVLEIPVTAEGYSSGFDLLEGLGPEEFLGAVKVASFFCTDSFHGLVFGTILGVRTEPFRRYREDDPESKNSRMDNFLRLIREQGPEELRTRGMNWLQKALE